VFVPLVWSPLTVNVPEQLPTVVGANCKPRFVCVPRRWCADWTGSETLFAHGPVMPVYVSVALPSLLIVRRPSFLTSPMATLPN